ncbi:Transcription initiation factor TFIID subunit 10 [Aphelenchoides besseyi]|nr:Transcription initiation factor TFIID subunit 10 [Aphelenchoides besseyi]
MDDDYEPPEKRAAIGEDEYGDHTETVEEGEQLHYSYPTEEYAKDQSMIQSGSHVQESSSSNPLEYEPVEMTQGHVLNGRTLGDFIESLNAVQPVIPDAVALHVMRKKGLTTEDPRIVRLISIATQKFISDIALDAMQLRETRTKLLDLEDGLINVVKLPNLTRELEHLNVPSEDLPSSSQINLTGTRAVKKSKLVNHFFDSIFNGETKRTRIRQAPSYRVRPAVIEGCNIPLEMYPRVSEGGDYLTNLVGVSLPSQVSSFVDRTFTFKNNFPLSFVAIGNTYRNTVNRSVEQRLNLSVLNIDQTEDAMRNSMVVDVTELHRLIQTTGLRLSTVNVSSNELQNHEQAAVVFHDKQKREVARFSLIGTYIAERLNIQLPFKEVEKPKFPFLSCISVDLDHILDLLE